MQRPRILIAESSGFPAEACSLLGQEAEIILTDLDRDALKAKVQEAEVLWVRLRHQVDAELLQCALQLRVVATPTTGLTHVDVDALARRGIDLLSLSGETEFLKDVRATAEHTVGLIFAMLRRIPAAVHHVQSGNWDRDRFIGSELFGKTIGIVGYGRLGRTVARYLNAFDARILAFDPAVAPGSLDPTICLVPLQTLLRESDIVSLHVNLTAETKMFFGRREFEWMKPHSYLVNTARGELVDEGALLEALRGGRLAGAALDVLAAENSLNLNGHPLIQYARTHSHLIVTPHLGGCTVESMRKTELFLAHKLHQYIRSKKQMHL